MNKFEEIKELLLEEYYENKLRQAYIFECNDLNKGLELTNEICKKIFSSEELDNISDYNLISKEDMNIQKIRKISKESFIKPFKDKKVYIFKDGMDFTVPMQNAFLKTLEEPSEYTIFFIIIQNSSFLLDTIRSRCMTFFLDNSKKDLYEKENLVILTRNLFDIIISKDKVKIIEYIEEIKKYKNDIDDIFSYILENSRNIMLAKESINLLPNESKQNKYIHDIVNKFSYYELLTIIDYVEQARIKLNSNCSFQMTIETMLFNIMEVKS